MCSISLPVLWICFYSWEALIWKQRAVDSKSLFIMSLCFQSGGNTRAFKRDNSLKYYSRLFYAALASTVQTHVPGPVIMWYCRHLSSLLLEGQALWCSLVSGPVSAVQTSHREVLWAAAMRDCDVSRPVYTTEAMTPSRPSFCQGPLTRSSLSPRQGSPLHLTPVPPHAVMSTTPPVTCPPACVPPLPLIGWWHAELSCKWPVCVEIKVGWCLLMRQT